MTEPFLQFQSSTLLDGLKVVEALSNEDAVNLFFYADKAISSSVRAIRALKLSQKRYYTRLKLLLEAGLLEKTERGYEHTFLGGLVHKLGLSLLKIIENREQLEVLNSIRESSNISPDTTCKIARALSVQMPFAVADDMRSILSPVKMIDSYDTLVEEIRKCIDLSESSIHFASKYPDIQVIEAAMSATDRGVHLSILVEEFDLSESIQAIRVLLSPKKMKRFVDLTNKLKNIVKKGPTLPYSFMIIDNKTTFVEVPHPEKNEFKLAFVFEDERVGENFASIFEGMWDRSPEFSVQ